MATATGDTGTEPVIISRYYSVDNPPQPRLAVVVVTYETRDLLRDFLLSVRAEQARMAGMPVKVVVVDNASTDGTAEMVRREFPDVRLIASAENGGPARAFNLGLAEVIPEADLVVISNSDVTIHAGTLEKMVEFLRKHPDVDGCCGRLYNSDGTPQVTRTRIWSLRRAPKDQPHRATFPGTTFAMFRAEAFARVGGFDETYYFYNEDLDWAERARKARLRFQYLPDASVTHHSGQGRRHNVSRIRRELYRANLYYYRRHYPLLAPLVYGAQLLSLRWGQRVRRRELQKVGQQSAAATTAYGMSPAELEAAAASELGDRVALLRQELADLEDAIQRMRREYRSPSLPQIPQFRLRLPEATGAQPEPAGGPTRTTGELDERAIAFVTCVSNPEQYAQCRRYIEALEMPEGFRVEVHAVVGARGMPSGYNAVLRRSRAKYKVYLHQDVFLLHRGLLREALQIFSDPTIGMIGVVGATQLPANGVWFRNNPLHCYGQLWEYRRSGGPKKLLGPLNRRSNRLMTFRAVRPRVLPVATVDGLLMITQYDLPWREDLYDGFIYYEGPQCLEFIKRGWAVVIPRQERDRIWCLHYGPPDGQERSGEAWAAYMAEFDRVMEIFRREYSEFLQVPVDELLRRFREAGGAEQGAH